MNILWGIAGAGVFEWIVAGIMTILGLIGCFAGYRTKKFWIGLAGYGLGFMAGFFVSRLFLDNIWICIGIGILAAVIFAVLAFCFYRAGIFCLCAVPMFVIIRVLFHQDEWWVYLLAAFSGVAAGIVGIYFEKVMLIVATGVSGAGLLSGAAGMFLEEDAALIKFIIIVAFTAVGIGVQLFLAGKQKEKPERERGKKEKPERKRKNGQSEEREQKQRHERRRQNREKR